MCADISHMILRTDTVYNFLRELQRSGRGRFRDQAVKALVGEIVLTRYNNNTYRIDDIEWSMSPQATFSTKSRDVCFVDYYKKNQKCVECIQNTCMQGIQKRVALICPSLPGATSCMFAPRQFCIRPKVLVCLHLTFSRQTSKSQWL